MHMLKKYAERLARMADAATDPVTVDIVTGGSEEQIVIELESMGYKVGREPLRPRRLTISKQT